ncbi:MAG TPA: phosphopantetheine-binding protein [Alphaproteobacteria bacterium]|jgi:acyl carrier protein
MTDEEIREKIFDIIAKEARIDRGTLTLETKLEDLKIESLDMVQILFGIEDAFDVYVPQDDQSFKLSTLNDVVDGVKRLVAAKQQQTA